MAARIRTDPAPQLRTRRLWLIAAAATALGLTFGLQGLVQSRLGGLHDPASASHLLRIGRALLTSLMLAALVVWWWPSDEWVLDVEAAQASGDSRHSATNARGLNRWLVRVRWVAVALSLGLITLTGGETRSLLTIWWALLVSANVIFERSVPVVGPRRLLTTQIVADLVILTGFLNASGGLENPAFSFYLFHVIVSHILLPRRLALRLTALAATLFLLLSFGEYLHLLPHYTNLFFPHELVEEGAGAGGHLHGGGASHASHDLFFVLGRTIPFIAVMLLASFLTASISRSLRLRERALERAVDEATLERSRLEGVVDTSGIGMMQLSPGLIIDWASTRVGQWLGAAPPMIGECCPLSLSSGCERCVAAETFETGRSSTARRTVHLSDGPRRHYRHSSFPVRDGNGRVVQVVEVIEDATAQRALEEEAISAGKLSVLGRMAAGIAHEIGNPLSSISTRLTLLERRPTPEFLSESVRTLREQIERISRIVHGVSHFGRRDRSGRREWDVESLLEETIGIVKLDERSRGVAFRLRLGAEKATVVAVRDHVVQILLNLLLNAAEAAPGDSSVELTCRREGESVHISVTNEGPPPPSEIRDHLFEPFFTTKEQGTGLGLSISAGLASSQGGRIEVDWPSADRTRFTLVLPTGSGLGATDTPIEARRRPH